MLTLMSSWLPEKRAMNSKPRCIVPPAGMTESTSFESKVWDSTLHAG